MRYKTCFKDLQKDEIDWGGARGVWSAIWDFLLVVCESELQFKKVKL